MKPHGNLKLQRSKTTLPEPNKERLESILKKHDSTTDVNLVTRSCSFVQGINDRPTSDQNQGLNKQPRQDLPPKLNQLRMSQSAWERKPPKIAHPMMSHREDQGTNLAVTGSASAPDMRREPEFGRSGRVEEEKKRRGVNIATCFSWAAEDMQGKKLS